MLAGCAPHNKCQARRIERDAVGSIGRIIRIKGLGWEPRQALLGVDPLRAKCPHVANRAERSLRPHRSQCANAPRAPTPPKGLPVY